MHKHKGKAPINPNRINQRYEPLGGDEIREDDMSKLNQAMTVYMVPSIDDMYVGSNGVNFAPITIEDTYELVSELDLSDAESIFDDLMIASQNGDTPKMCLCPYNLRVNQKNVLLIARTLRDLEEMFDRALDAVDQIDKLAA